MAQYLKEVCLKDTQGSSKERVLTFFMVGFGGFSLCHNFANSPMLLPLYLCANKLIYLLLHVRHEQAKGVEFSALIHQKSFPHLDTSKAKFHSNRDWLYI